MSILKLIQRLEIEMEQGWCDYENGITPSGDVYDTIQDLIDLGLGGVFITSKFGRMKWFDLNEQSF